MWQAACLSLGYEQTHLSEFGVLFNKAAVQPSAEAGESADQKMAIQR